MTPLHRLDAVAPSGATGWMVKYTIYPAELAWADGRFTAAEYPAFHRARLRAQSGKAGSWATAVAILRDAGFTVEEAS